MAWKRILLEGDAAVLSDVAPVNVSHAVAAAGNAAAASRQDHKHDLDEGVVGSLAPVDGGASALGTSDAVARVDHKHALGPLVANLNMAQYEILNHILHKASNIVGGIEGQIFYDTDDDHVWVATE